MDGFFAPARFKDNGSSRVTWLARGSGGCSYYMARFILSGDSLDMARFLHWDSSSSVGSLLVIGWLF